MPGIPIEIDFSQYLPELQGADGAGISGNISFGINRWNRLFIRINMCKRKHEIEQGLFNQLISSKNVNQAESISQQIISENYCFSKKQLKMINKVEKCLGGETFAHVLALMGYRFSISDLLEMGNPFNEDGLTVAHVMARQGHAFSFSELKAIKNPAIENESSQNNVGLTVAHEMARQGNILTHAEIMHLGNPKRKNGESLLSLSHMNSQQMVKNGHRFTVDEIIRMGNRRDSCGATLAHWMAFYGHRFTVDELIRLKNPRVIYTEMAHQLLIPLREFEPSTYTEASWYTHKSEVLHDGGTVAHIMAREGCQFTDEGIEALGNPVDGYGMTIKDWMGKDKSFDPRPEE